MMMSNLPHDLVEEILSRVPLASLRAVRFTCKKWNALTKDQSFTDKHIVKTTASGEREFLMVMDHNIYLMGFNLHGVDNNVDLSIKCKGKLISLDNSDKLFLRSQVFHCNGLLLCLSRKYTGTSLVVWNPYCVKSKWIKPRDKYRISDTFFFGYDKSCGSHKILRLFDFDKFEIYSLSSNSWMVSNVNFERDIVYRTPSVPLKGNTYWYARDKESGDHYLICFDFTRERFGPRLCTPFDGGYAYLSVVKEEQLAVLLQRWDTLKIEIWVTNKIEPDAVSWSNFLIVDMKPNCRYGNFFIDEEKKVAFVFNQEEMETFELTCNVAYIIGDKGYFRRVDFGESLYSQFCPIFCSYVPSSAQIN